MRECGDCTKCCEGWLNDKIRDVEIYPGKPCPILEIGKGCTDYENRPKNPCQTFECQWKIDPSIPEDLKPSISGSILTEKEIDGSHYVMLHRAPDTNPEVLTWLFFYALKNQKNIVWQTAKSMHWLGDSKFTQAMNNTFRQ